MSIVTIYHSFVEERITCAVAISELLDPVITVGLLVIELVGGECKDLQAFFTISVVELCHPLIVRSSQASEASHVCDKCHILSSCQRTNLSKRL